MNFQQLMSKIKSIDESSETSHAPTDSPLLDETNVEECGMPGMANMPSGMMGTPKQSDSVTMNVSMNGSGAGGIRDLMSILKNIEHTDGGHDVPASDFEVPHGDDEIVVGMEEVSDGDFGSATTEPRPEVADIDAVTGTGNDLHSKGSRGRGGVSISGSNGLAEALSLRLDSLYQEIKAR